MIVDLSTHPRRYVTVPDLVAYLQLPRETVYWHIRAGKLDVVKFGPKTYRVETTEAQRWAELYAFPRICRLSKSHKPTRRLVVAHP